MRLLGSELITDVGVEKAELALRSKLFLIGAPFPFLGEVKAPPRCPNPDPVLRSSRRSKGWGSASGDPVNDVRAGFSSDAMRFSTENPIGECFLVVPPELAERPEALAGVNPV